MKEDRKTVDFEELRLTEAEQSLGKFKKLFREVNYRFTISDGTPLTIRAFLLENYGFTADHKLTGREVTTAFQFFKKTRHEQRRQEPIKKESEILQPNFRNNN